MRLPAALMPIRINWLQAINSGYTFTNEKSLSHPFKQTIAVTVRKLHPAVHDVFISANRDFLNRMNAYAQEAWKGGMLDAYVNEFNEMCNRIFAAPEPDVGKED